MYDVLGGLVEKRLGATLPGNVLKYATASRPTPSSAWWALTDGGTDVAWTRRARSFYEFSLFADPELTRDARRIIQAGHQARFVPELPVTLVIMDESTVMFGMQGPGCGNFGHDNGGGRAPVPGPDAQGRF